MSEAVRFFLIGVFSGGVVAIVAILASLWKTIRAGSQSSAVAKELEKAKKENEAYRQFVHDLREAIKAGKPVDEAVKNLLDTDGEKKGGGAE